MLLLLGKSIGTSKYTIVAFKFVKKSGSEIHDHKNVLHRLCNLLECFVVVFFCKICTCIYPIIVSILLKFFC